MAAYASLVSLMNLINDLKHHPSPPISLDKHLIASITQHVAYFEEFLHAYNNTPPPPVDEEAADPLEMRIAASAYAAEDAIESHIVESIQLQWSDDFCSKITTRLLNCFRAPRVPNIGRVIKEMDSIKKVMMVLKADTQKKVLSLVHDNVPVSVSRSDQISVGFDGVLLEIMEKLIGGRSNLQVIPIVGMGGIGKTFLANTVYADPRVKEHFDVCAWATISQQYSTKEILCELLSQATCKEKKKRGGKSEDELGSKLHKILFGRRFFIVMDDIWSIDAWDKIQRFFPSNDNGSRVLVTTRLSNLCSQLNNDYNLPMSFLDETSSWDLFSKTVFGEKSCPPELKEIGEKIVEKCRGLPLSIVVVGGLLKKMDNARASWESIHGNLTSVVNMENDKHCLRLLKMSYSYLPVHLKPCFLYMGVFDEDEEIGVSRLVKRWVSEGFLKPRNGEALKTTARRFLQDLVDRNLILVCMMGPTGSIKSCKMHDLVRDLCFKEGHKEGLYHVIEKNNLPMNTCMNTQRRVVIPCKSSTESDYDDLRSMSHTRSITCYGELPQSLSMAILLRTLHTHKDSERGYDEDYLNSLTFQHVNLRHLAIDVSMTDFSLDFVSLFWNLQTLVVYGYPKMIFIEDFWKMPQLRHIEVARGNLCILDLQNRDERDADDVVIKENLHTLKGVRNFKFCERVVKRIPNIRILKIQYYELRGVDRDYCVENIKYLCRLESLSVLISSDSLPNKLTFPHSLKKLSLSMSTEFRWEDAFLDTIGSLPLLEELKLHGGSFRNAKLEIVEGQFPCLKYLELCLCWGLVHWAVAEEGSDILPRLEHLRLDRLKNLKTIPCELGNINTLKEIRMAYCREEAVWSAKAMFDEQVDSQGGAEQLCFQVVVHDKNDKQYMLFWEGPNFQVILDSESRY